ncbi:MAG: alpha/beta fold hydrolase, partial [Gemmatimonadota bacterium]|nr:alpha/beta fold hydrolase [Gemmatimonadota bacterium]
VNADFRGHGLSGPAEEPFDLHDLVDDQIAILDHLGIERAVWAGLSIGGMVAMRAALARPDRVAALALLDTDARAETRARKLRFGAMGLAARAVGIRPLLPAIVPLFFSRGTRRADPELVDEWRMRFASMHVPSMRRFLDALLARDPIVDRLGEIGVPALVVVGAEDSVTPPDLSEEIATAIPEASLVVVPHAGHLSALERPDEVTPALIDFLESLPEPHEEEP